MLDPFRVPQGKLEHRRGAGGDADDVDLGDRERVEQGDEGVGLVRRRRSGWYVRAQVAEPRWSDDAPAREQAAEEHRTLAALEDAVTDQQRLAGATLGVLDVTESGRDPSRDCGG